MQIRLKLINILFNLIFSIKTDYILFDCHSDNRKTVIRLYLLCKSHCVKYNYYYYFIFTIVNKKTK